MPSRLIIDGNTVYEVDEDCERCFSDRQNTGKEKGREAERKRNGDPEYKGRSQRTKRSEA